MSHAPSPQIESAGTANQTAKQVVRRILDQLPDDCTLDQVRYHLHVAQVIQQRIKMADEGQGVSHAQAIKRFEQWLK